MAGSTALEFLFAATGPALLWLCSMGFGVWYELHFSEESAENGVDRDFRPATLGIYSTSAAARPCMNEQIYYATQNTNILLVIGRQTSRKSATA